MTARGELEQASTISGEGSLTTNADSFDGLLRELAHVPTHAAGSSNLVPGNVVAGKFRVERSLGRGGMGAVYAVRHEITRHMRALKLLHADRVVPEVVQRFLAEASAAGRADSPHLVETFDAGVLPSGEPYLVMELLEGSTLADLLAREGKLNPGLACELVAQAAEGMHAAHCAGIVHRDLKPDNLFIVQRPEGPFVKVLDFGISKFNSLSLASKHDTQDNAIFGTPAYMAPEQLRSAKDVDARADVFALGAVLFECLGGETPHEADSMTAVVARIVSGQSTPLESLRADLPDELYAVVRRAIGVDPAERTPSARRLIEELAPFREHAPSGPLPRPRHDGSTEPPPHPFTLSRGKALSALALLLVVVALGFAWWRRGVEQRIAVPAPPAPAPDATKALDTQPGMGTGHLAPNRWHEAIPASAPPGSTPHQLRPAPALITGNRKRTSELVPEAPLPSAEPSGSRARALGLSDENPYR